MVVAGEHDAEHLEGDLLRIGVALEVAFVDRQAHRLLADGIAAMLVGDHRVADRPGPVVVFVGGRDHDAAARQARGEGPVEPALEERAQPRQPALDLQHRHEHLLAVALRRVLQHRELQVLARAEVREQARLRHAGGLRQAADRQSFEPEAARDLERLVEDRCPRLFALGRFVHAPHKIVRTFGSVNGPSRPRARDGLHPPCDQGVGADIARYSCPCRPPARECLRQRCVRRRRRLRARGR